MKELLIAFDGGQLIQNLRWAI